MADGRRGTASGINGPGLALRNTKVHPAICLKTKESRKRREVPGVMHRVVGTARLTADCSRSFLSTVYSLLSTESQK